MHPVHGSPGANVLIVAHRTAATPRLIDAVRQRAQEGPCAFTLLVPADYWEADTERAAAVVELALPLLEQACDGHVDARIGAHDPFVAVQDALGSGDFDEVMISTLPERVSHWLRRDLPTRVRALGLPVTVVIAEGRHAAANADR
ncbi:MAG TPA: hypothetical protein VK501_20170 [Baekduia sp.]|uniref:hypothetical protein n=1 Tax=Baekduia sp. TaxID=2600305 RepID=UPI002CD6D51F|nr:hypothetical protein [Baekduia sp.]HMJ36228.1 hypothetical protein [Baekduia sp.]